MRSSRLLNLFEEFLRSEHVLLLDFTNKMKRSSDGINGLLGLLFDVLAELNRFAVRLKFTLGWLVTLGKTLEVNMITRIPIMKVIKII